MSESLEGLFDESVELPNANAKKRLAQLVGLDSVKERLIKEARILINPGEIEEWSKKHYGGVVPLIKAFEKSITAFHFRRRRRHRKDETRRNFW